MKSYLLFALLLISNHFLLAQSQSNETIEVSLDNVAFDENDLMKIYTSEDNTIGYYDRFENKSSETKAVRLYDSEKNLIYTLVPVLTDQGYAIHLKNNTDQRGLLELTEHLNGFKLNYKSDVDYFNQPYAFNYDVKLGIGKVSIKQDVIFQGKKVISYQEKVAAFSGISTSPISVDRSYFETHKEEVANWTMVLQLLNELSVEVSKQRRNTSVAGLN